MPIPQVSIEAAAETLGRDRRSIGKACREAGLQPRYDHGRVGKYDLGAIVRALQDHDRRIGYQATDYVGGNSEFAATANTLEDLWRQIEGLCADLIDEPDGPSRVFCAGQVDQIDLP
jgi:hypothetical protein